MKSIQTQISELNSQADYQKDCERFVLGITILEPSTLTETSTIVRPNDFLDPVFGELFSIVEMMKESNEPVTTHSVMLAAKKVGLFEKLGGAAEYGKLVSGAPIVHDAKYYALEIARLSKATRIHNHALRMADAMRAKDADPAKAIAEFDSLAKTLSADLGKCAIHVHDCIDSILNGNDKENSVGLKRRIPTGYPMLDTLIGGYFVGSLILLGGRFGKGKSAMAAETVALASSKGYSTLIFSLEMTNREFTERILSSFQGVSMSAWPRKLYPEEIDEIRRLANDREKYRWRIDDSPRQTVRTIRSACQLAKAREGLDLVIVDNLQLIQSLDARIQRDQQLKAITEELKRIAKELDVAIVLLAQLNAEAENTEPDNTSWAGCKAIVGDADTAMMLHHLSDGTPDYNLIVTKNRSGERDKIPMRFDGEYQRFSERTSIFNASDEVVV